METYIIQAVVHNGNLLTKEKLDLPENTLVQVQITPLITSQAGFASLKGIWSILPDDDIDQAIKDLEISRRATNKKIIKITPYQ